MVTRTVTLPLPQMPGERALTIGRWRQQVGQRVSAGEPLVEAHSERLDWDIPAPCDGIPEEIRAGVGTRVAPGDVLATVAVETADMPRAARISPLAAGAAQALGVEIGGLRGSGPGGRVVRADVLAVAKVAGDRLARFTDGQRAHAAQVAASHRTVPHASQVATLAVDAVDTECARGQARWRARERFVLERLPYLVHAALAALRVVPDLNGLFTPEGVARRGVCHLLVQVDADAGYAARIGVICHAEQYGLVGIARHLNALPSDPDAVFRQAQDATFAVRAHSGMMATTTLKPGQSACLVLGAASKQPRVSPTGEVRAQTVVHACLTWDARVANEADAARFLVEMQRALAGDMV